MINNLRMLAEEEESDDAAEVTWEDQQRISTFSKLNARLRGIEGSLDALKQENDALDDLATELELVDEDQAVLYKIGESFLHMAQPRSLDRLQRDQADVQAQLASLATTAQECEQGMNDLKRVLYSKFGRAINLDE